jgi:hypothetical protein
LLASPARLSAGCRFPLSLLLQARVTRESAARQDSDAVLAPATVRLRAHPHRPDPRSRRGAGSERARRHGIPRRTAAAPARQADQEPLRMKTPSLDDVLAYENSDIVHRFHKAYGISREEAADIFMQVKKWLWLANLRRQSGLDGGLHIDMSLVVIDEMWHNFVLFTKEYSAFCQRYFGYYLHHAPTTEAEERGHKDHLHALPRLERLQARKEQMRAQCEYIYDHLGNDTFVKWYLEYPKTYGYLRLAQLQLAAAEAQLAEIRPQAAAA